MPTWLMDDPGLANLCIFGVHYVRKFHLPIIGKDIKEEKLDKCSYVGIIQNPKILTCQ